MEKERKITAPEGCEIEKVELVDGAAVVTFREKVRKLPRSWEEFCEMYDVSDTEYFIDDVGDICNAIEDKTFISRDIEDKEFISRDIENDKNFLPDRATAEAVLALCQLIQLRNAYNGDWVPDWDDEEQEKYVITFVCCDEITITDSYNDAYSPLYFKNEELAKEFLRYFRHLIEKLKSLYGIKEEGEK